MKSTEINLSGKKEKVENEDLEEKNLEVTPMIIYNGIHLKIYRPE
jgi:hypothetical protein